ncbi:MAG: DNA polymerase III subunit delta, partial [Streptococcus gordonii]
MLAIEEIKTVNVTNLPNLTILTGDDTGQFETCSSSHGRSRIQF